MSNFERIIGRRCGNFSNFEDIPHYCVPSLNALYETTSSKDIFDRCNFIVNRHSAENYEKLSYRFSSLLPFGEPALLSVENLNALDPATELLENKSKWEKLKGKIILCNLKSNYRQICKKQKHGLKYVSPGVVKLAQHLDKDPDPNFCGRYFYNWYYSEGCLNSMTYSNENYLLSTRNSTPGVLYVTPLNITEEECIPINCEKICKHTENKQNIFQTAVKNNFILVRQKNFSTLYMISDKGERKRKLKKIHEGCEPNDSIVCIDFSNKSDGEYCSLTTSRTLKIWSPDKKSDYISCFKFNDSDNEKSCDQWGSVKYLSDHYFLLSTRNCVYLKDKRTSLSADLKWWPLKSKFDCDFISLLLKSNFSNNYSYLGTKHNLFELDFRSGFKKEWTHMMKFAPMFGTSCSISESTGTLFIGSQSLNEVIVFESGKHIMPYILQSPNEMIQNAKLHGICLDPAISIRCNFSMVGLTCIPYENKTNKVVYVLRSTSVGDIFFQKLIKESEVDLTLGNDYVHSNNDQFLELLSIWDKKCVESIQNFSGSPLKVTDIVNKRDTYKMLISKKERKKRISKPIKQSCSRKVKSPSFKCNISKKQLQEEQNPLAQCIVDVWDIEDDEEWYKKGKNKGIDIEKSMNNTSIVESWFNQASNVSTKLDNFTDLQPGNILRTEGISFSASNETDSPCYQNPDEDVLNHNIACMENGDSHLKKVSNSNYKCNNSHVSDFGLIGNGHSSNFPLVIVKKKVNKSLSQAKFSSGF